MRPVTGTVSPQVIIVIYLSVVGALLLYMAFLMLVDPLIRKPDAYTERLHNEEENEVMAGLLRTPGPGGGPALCAPVRPPVQCATCHPDSSFSLSGTALCFPVAQGVALDFPDVQHQAAGDS